MLKSKKKAFVSDLEKIYQASNSVIITRYHGLSVSDLTVLRSSLKENGSSFKVIKNTLSKIAISNVSIPCDTAMFSGPTAIAYSVDPIAAAKCVVSFAKTNKNLQIIGGIVNDQILDVESINNLAKLPSIDQLRAKIIGVLQAPAIGVAQISSAPAKVLVRLINAYTEK